MRGPLLSGALGSPATLGRVASLVRDRAPVVILSALWLAETLSSEMAVLALVEEDKEPAARRALRRARKAGHRLDIVVAAGEVPLRPATVDALLLDSLVDIEEEAAARDLLVALLPALKPGAIVISLDATKSPPLEARVAEIFLASSLAKITQARPREGALLTVGFAPHPAVSAARSAALATEQ